MSDAASVSSLAKRMRPFISAAARSKAGAMARQGPHHAAQKSTTTGSSVRSTATAKLALVTGTGWPSRRGVLHLPHTGASPSRSAGTRLSVAHAGQPISTSSVYACAGDLHDLGHLGVVGAQQFAECLGRHRL